MAQDCGDGGSSDIKGSCSPNRRPTLPAHPIADASYRAASGHSRSWALLLMYPTLCNVTLATFSCSQLQLGLGNDVKHFYVMTQGSSAMKAGGSVWRP